MHKLIPPTTARQPPPTVAVVWQFAEPHPLTHNNLRDLVWEIDDDVPLPSAEEEIAADATTSQKRFTTSCFGLSYCGLSPNWRIARPQCSDEVHSANQAAGLRLR